ncbi:MAG: tRNA (adenine-N1)-methyltransferase, partial [Acidimicrobiaceae bacterium]|nr:tRNA (adenine-N1)-methyltransferase [Acidimicrobiaceae bacterium]
MTARGPLQVGEMVLLIDRKKRRYLIDLVSGGEFHTHSGVLSHDELIGADEGTH